MSFELPESAKAWQAKVRGFVEAELIPHEVEAEMNGGALPDAVTRRHGEIARGLGLSAMDVPEERGGLALTTLEQAVVWEQLGRATNALSWCFSEPHRWMFEVCSEDQIERYVMPLMTGQRHECYAISEADAGSDVDAIQATARPDGEVYVLDGEKWYVTGANMADFCLFQAKLVGVPEEGQHALLFVDMASPGVELLRTPPFAHSFAAHHPVYRFSGVRVPAANLIGRPGEGMSYTHSWFRRERLMIAARCCGAAERLLDEALAFAKQRVVSGQAIANKCWIGPVRLICSSAAMACYRPSPSDWPP